MSLDDFIKLVQVMGVPLAVYVAVRIDIATARIRLDHLERDLYNHTEDTQDPHWRKT